MMAMTRSAPLVAALVLAPALAAPAVAQASTAGRTEFQILMNGNPVGRHSVTVTVSGQTATADIAIDMAGRVGPIRFSYSHRCRETWAGNALQSMDCTDVENGARKSARARRDGATIAITGTGFTGTVPATLLPSSWWRSGTVRQSELLDSRDGRVTRVRVQRLGESTVTVAGSPVPATHWRIRGSVNTDLWYDSAGRWVGTAFRLAGQSFEYRKTTRLENAPRA